MPTANVTKKRGIVVRLVEHKDADLIVTAISEDGLFSFYARGARKITSKNGAALQKLVKSEFVLSEPANGLPILKEASPLMSYMPESDFDACVIANFLLEILTKFSQEEDSVDLYPWFEGALRALKDEKDPLTAGLIFFARSLVAGGIGLEVDRCVVCGSRKRIASTSYGEGGFVCEECFEADSMERMPEMMLKIIRYIFRAPITDFGRVSLDRTYALRVLRSLLEYSSEMTGAHLTSCQFLFE